MDANANRQGSESAWEKELAALLAELTSVQTELLEVLEAKRASMGRNDLSATGELQPRAEQLLQRLEACHERRASLLHTTEVAGLRTDSLTTLASRAARENRAELVKQVKDASHRMRLLHHHSLSNWVLAQRTLLHVAQMLEIIASGGRLQPTYGNGESFSSRGALVDRAA